VILPNRKQKFELKLIRNCIKVCYKDVDIEASSLRLQHTIRYDSHKYASTDIARFSNWCHTFKMAAITSFQATKVLPPERVNAKHLLAPMEQHTSVSDLQYIRSCYFTSLFCYFFVIFSSVPHLFLVRLRHFTLYCWFFPRIFHIFLSIFHAPVASVNAIYVFLQLTALFIVSVCLLFTFVDIFASLIGSL